MPTYTKMPHVIRDAKMLPMWLSKLPGMHRNSKFYSVQIWDTNFMQSIEENKIK
jgi:hypothetical protein